MGEASLKNLITIKCMLRCFELVFGLKVNFFQIRFDTIGVAMEDMMRYANLLNCKILDFPFLYLGMSLLFT